MNVDAKDFAGQPLAVGDICVMLVGNSKGEKCIIQSIDPPEPNALPRNQRTRPRFDKVTLKVHSQMEQAQFDFSLPGHKWAEIVNGWHLVKVLG